FYAHPLLFASLFSFSFQCSAAPRHLHSFPTRRSSDLPQPGGMLRYGIPEYRLQKDLMDREIDHVWDLGVDLQLNVKLGQDMIDRSEEHTSELQSRSDLVCRLLLEKKKKKKRKKKIKKK